LRIVDLHCTGCGHPELSQPYRLGQQAAVLNYRFPDEVSARAVPRGQLSLIQCERCGLIFNGTFQPDLVPYDSNYENRQCFSPSFTDYLDGLAQKLLERHPLRDGRVLEIGCGKGDFLRLLCTKAGAQGLGYDTSFEGELVDADGRTRFSRSYLTAEAVHEPATAIVCRHVIEHVPAIGDFLEELYRIARRAQAGVIVLETPRFEWIAEQAAFWDLFYEHCNYFSMATLRWLCERAGFRVLRHEAVFGDQYQWLELTPDCVLPSSCQLDAFSLRAEAAVQRLESQILEQSGGGDWAFWGAGAKGVALVNRLSLVPRFVIDINPAKQGGVISGSGVSIVGPDDPRLLELQLIAVTNSNYMQEITQTLRERGYRMGILAVG